MGLVERSRLEWTTNQAIADRNTVQNIARDIPVVTPDDRFAGKRVAVVGGGPSLPDFIADLAEYPIIIACNGAHDWLIKHGIQPTHWLSFDPWPIVARYLTAPIRECTYLPAFCCDSAVFRALDGYDAEGWLASQGDDHVPPVPGQWIGGGPTSPLRAVALAYGLGAREIGLFGLDSSFSDVTHAYGDAPVRYETVFRAGRFWKTNKNMLEQAEYLRILQTQKPADLDLEWHCTGLGPSLARM